MKKQYTVSAGTIEPIDRGKIRVELSITNRKPDGGLYKQITELDKVSVDAVVMHATENGVDMYTLHSREGARELISEIIESEDNLIVIRFKK